MVRRFSKRLAWARDFGGVEAEPENIRLGVGREGQVGGGAGVGFDDGAEFIGGEGAGLIAFDPGGLGGFVGADEGVGEVGEVGEKVIDGAPGAEGGEGGRDVGVGEAGVFAKDVEADENFDVDDFADGAGADEIGEALDGRIKEVVVVFDEVFAPPTCRLGQGIKIREF